MRLAWLRWLPLVALAIPVAQCGGEISDDSDGSDALVTCTAASPTCPAGQRCFFPVSEGCAGLGHCVGGYTASCKGGPACGCDGKTNFALCGPMGYASEPVQHAGPCEDAVAPPTCADDPACELCDLSGYAAPQMAAPKVQTNACTQEEIAAFVTACASPGASQQTCEAWQSSEDAGACSACILTMQTDAAWGPLVCGENGCVLNAGGCVDLLLGTVSAEKGEGGAGSCGDRVDAENGCESYACGTCGDADFGTCVQFARTQGCATYAAAAQSGPCLGSDATSAAAQCGGDLGSLINLFCGTGP